ncbi:MAG: hypothetical protein AAF492_22690, partial [Verrucomicrobiota bacterium]
MKKLLITISAAFLAFGSSSAQEYPRETVESDLLLLASLATSKNVGPGAPIELNTAIFNQSAGTTYYIVMPGDGT